MGRTNMSSVLILETPNCCELCRFIDYDPKCHCGMLPYEKSKIENRFSKLENCPLRKLPEKHNEDDRVVGEEWAVFNKGWNACIDEIMKQS